MLVFIDESGDAGFKLDRNSSRFFVVAAIIFDDTLEAEKCAVRIKEFRRELGFSDAFEFKFNKTQKEIRRDFLLAILPFKFRIRCIVVDKNIIRSSELKTKTKSFYSFIAKTLLKHSHKSIINASIKIDGSGGREFRREFSSYLKREINGGLSQIAKDIKLVDSKQNVLIQLADMIAGATRKSCEDADTDQKIYKDIIKDKYEDCWNFR